MTNIANVKSEHFRAIAEGRKSTEWRRRARPDSTLEQVTVGEPILLLEIGSTRAIRARVRAVMRFDYSDHVTYAIRLFEPRVISMSAKRVQGWHRH